MNVILVLAGLAALAWAYLLTAHGRFWRADQWLAAERAGLVPQRAVWPAVAAVIPARDEADVIAASIESHLRSRYPGSFSVILVDDASADGTADNARAVSVPGTRHGLHVIAAPPLAPGWTGKIAAQRAGLDASHRIAPDARYVLFTDADIVHGPDTLARLVAKAEEEDRVLVSLMARLDDRGLWGGLLIPAFVFFFQMLYPFPKVNDPRSSVAGAAGGCMLARRDVFAAAGGFEAMRTALIDDCTLARLMKGVPPRHAIWLGLTRELTSQRDNRSLDSVWSMVARSAYAQLDYSPLLLAGTLLGMVLVYLTGPVLVLTMPWHGSMLAAGLGLAVWIAMAVSYAPTLRLYGRSALQGVALPLAACLYTAMTVSSALRHWQGRGGAWKGRTYSDLSKEP